MNRFKREIRKKVKLDFPYLPFYLKGNSPFEVGNIMVDDVSVNTEKATAYRHLNIGTEVYTMRRDGTVKYDFE